MKLWNLCRNLVDREIVEGCARACVFLGGLYLMIFAAFIFEVELVALLGR